MADARGTLDRAVEELTLALAGLEELLAPARVPALLRELGLEDAPDFTADPGFTQHLADAVQLVIDLGPEAEALVSAVDQEDIPALVEHAAKLIETIRQLIPALDTLADDLRQFTTGTPDEARVATFAGVFVERLIETALVRHLQTDYPFISRVLELLTFVEVTSSTVNVGGQPLVVVRRRLHLDRIQALLQDPTAFVQTAYGWGTAGFDDAALFARVSRLFEVIGPLAVFAEADAEGPADITFFTITFRPTTDTPPGIEGRVHVDLPPSLDMPIARLGESWSVRLQLSGQLGADAALRLLPPAKLQILSAGAVSGSAALALVGESADPSTPLTLLALPGGTRLQAGRLETGLVASFRWNSAEGRATGDAGFLLSLQNATFLIDTSESDSFIASLLPAEPLALNASFELGWSAERGFYFSGSAGLETTLSLHAVIGPFTLESLFLGFTATGAGLTIEASLSGGASLGPLAVSVERIGLIGALRFERGNLGLLDLGLEFKPPTGLGIAIDAGPVTGGGFIAFDEPNARYAGILQLRLETIGVTAIGLLDTRLPGGQPGYSFLIIIAVNLPPIQLGFGFTLTGIGGLAGINRTVITDAIVQGLRNGVLDHIMFPPDPIRNAPQIISDLRTVFPPAAGRYVFGPMLQLAWGTPSLIIGQLGVILEVPDPVRLILIGQLKMELPTHDTALVEIHVDLLGVVDFSQKLLTILASLHDSRVTIYSIYGDMALRLFWGEPPNFALAMGGWNPHFTPPPGMPELRRLTIALGTGDNPRFTCQSYFAVTSNSFQFGALVEAYAEASGFNVHGWIGFDALVIFSPFSFLVDISAGVELRRGSSVIAGIHLSGHLAGPNPWHVWGEACLSLFFFDICVGFDATIGDKKPEALPTADPWPLLQAAITKPESWSASLPPTAVRAVALAVPLGSAPALLVDPIGGVSLHQKVLPLDRKITRFGEATPLGPDHYDVTAVLVGGAPAPAWSPVKDYFASGQFQELSNAEKLSRPSFELMDAGVSVASDAAAHGASMGMDVEYETIIVDAPDVTRVAGVYKLGLARQLAMASRGAAARSAIWRTGLGGFTPPLDAAKPLATAATTYTVASTADLSARFDIAGPGTMGEAHDALAAYLEANPGERGTLQVVPVHEVEAAA